MLKIMFVCHGNICRSPMAEFIFKKMIKDRGLDSKYSVSSSATSTEEIGNTIYPPAKAELRARGVEFSYDKRAVQIRKDDYNKYDLFVGMDGANIRNMNRIFGADPGCKIRKLMDYTGKGGDVSDPWYSDRFDIAFDDIYEGCECLLNELESKT